MLREFVSHFFIIPNGFREVVKRLIRFRYAVQRFSRRIIACRSFLGFRFLRLFIQCFVVLVIPPFVLNQFAVLANVSDITARLTSVITEWCELDDGLIMFGGFIPLATFSINLSRSKVPSLCIFSCRIRFDNGKIGLESCIVKGFLLGKFLCSRFWFIGLNTKSIGFFKGPVSILDFYTHRNDTGTTNNYRSENSKKCEGRVSGHNTIHGKTSLDFTNRSVVVGGI